MRHLSNIIRLGGKELRSLWSDKVLLVLVIWVFTGGIYVAATATSETAELSAFLLRQSTRGTIRHIQQAKEVVEQVEQIILEPKEVT